MIAVPECDKCGEIWLPDKLLPNKLPNPARENPRLCKRCGKCKTPTWNYKEEPARKKRKMKPDENKVVMATDEWLG